MSRHTSMSTNTTTRKRADVARTTRIERDQLAKFERNLRALDGMRLQGLGAR